MFEPGERLGDRYVLRERLGAGGMAVVWAADDTRLGRRVAVKVLREGDDDLGRRLRRESRVLAGLHHPAIVDVYDAGEAEGCPYVVLELVPGETLADRLARDGRLPADQVAVLGAELADGLAHAHELGIVHRDVKPSNVLVGPDGRPRLVDFGIARRDGATRITSTGLGLGTAAYASPEQLEGQVLGPSTDVYSLGLLLAEALSGTGPFPGAPAVAVLARLQGDPDLAGVPPAWVPPLSAMTRRDPAERPSAAAVAQTIAAVGSTAVDPTVPAHGAWAPTVPSATAPRDRGLDTEPLSTAPLGAAVGATETLATAPPATEPLATEPLGPTPPGTVWASASDPVPGRPPVGDLGRRRPLWLALAALVLVLGVAVGWGLAGSGGEAVQDRPAGAGATNAATSAPTVASTSVPSTTAAPPVTTTTTAVPAPAAGPGNGHGRGHDKPKEHGHR